MAFNQKETSTFKLFFFSTFDIYNLNIASRKISSRRFEIRRQDYFSKILILNATVLNAQLTLAPNRPPEHLKYDFSGKRSGKNLVI